MDVIDVISTRHRHVATLLERLAEKPRPEIRAALLGELSAAVKLTTRIEEQVFYTAFRRALQTPQDYDHFLAALEAHCATAEIGLARLRQMGTSDPGFWRQLQSLRSRMAHHHRHEAEVVFPRARQILSDVRLRRLAKRARQLCRGHHPVSAPA